MAKHIVFFSFWFCITMNNYAQLVYVSSNTLLKLEGNNVIDDTASTTPSLFINGSIENNGTISNDGELQLTGSITNNFDFFTEGDEVFVGDSLQNINGVFIEGGYFNNLVLAKSNNHVQLNTDIEVGSHLNFASGWIDGNGFSTFVQSNEQGAVHNGGESGTYNHYLAGTLIQYMDTNVLYTFPIGNIAEGCQNVRIYFNDLGDGVFLTITYHGDSLGSVTYTACADGKNYTSRTGDWEVTMDGTNGTYNYAITLLPDGLNNLGNSTFNAMRKDGVFVSDECSDVNGNHTVENLTSFSHFVLLGGMPVFPITILAFEGRWEGNHAFLTWTTEAEKNSDYFELERTTVINATSNDWKSIAKINAAGSSTSTLSYQYNDENAAFQTTTSKPKIYYRLKMIDKDGSYQYSNEIELGVNKTNNSFEIYPNPTADKIYIIYKGNTDEKYKLTLFDAQGKIIMKELYNPLLNEIASLNLENISKGFYFLTITNEKVQLLDTVRIIKE